LPGDPGRALLLAQTLLDGPKMFNHNRGLWGYTGTAGDGELLTVQSTGMGGPCAAIVIARGIDAGARAVEMETATLFALAARRGLQAAAVLVVSDLLLPTRARIDPEALRDAERKMGELVLRALRLQPRH
jgi:uridine phosphorylase